MVDKKKRWALNRLRKWGRKKFGKKDPMALMYWKHWHKLHGGHIMVWK